MDERLTEHRKKVGAAIITNDYAMSSDPALRHAVNRFRTQQHEETENVVLQILSQINPPKK